ncbi:hypothetical protein HMI55_004773 [Coelomomyces lativittatus]|nr:hypothetical protein HMI55_004773 [Coelomomyces lativittatus]
MKLYEISANPSILSLLTTTATQDAGTATSSSKRTWIMVGSVLGSVVGLCALGVVAKKVSETRRTRSLHLSTSNSSESQSHKKPKTRKTEVLDMADMFRSKYTGGS